MITDDTVLDRRAITAWMDECGLGSGEPGEFLPLSGGTQNREITLLEALASTDVPHPRLVAACASADVLRGAVFYLMEPVHGFNAAVGLPASWRQDRRIRHQMGLSLVDALARAQAGQADVATGGRLHATALSLFDRAHRRIAG